MPALLVPVVLAVVVDALGCFLDAEGALLLVVTACDATHATVRYVQTISRTITKLSDEPIALEWTSRP